ncbi:MAG: SDR family oxidoreductase [Leptospiraceae bacterium]|nr:SDR family oxidoreductase [Leptospiraceae bacterium]
MSKKVAYITGASGGIGEAFARKLIKDYSLVLIARSSDKLNRIAEELSSIGKAEIIVADLTKQKDVKAIQDRIAQDKELAMLINNAGFGTTGKFSELNLNKELTEIQLNVNTLIRLSHAASNNFLKRNEKGMIINVSSITAFLPIPGSATYAATKAYVKSFGESLHEELKEKGIYVQTLCPGFTRTNFQDTANFDKSLIPDFFWMDASQVVEESLKSAGKKEAVCIPGLLNRSTTTVLDLIPGDILRKLSSFLVDKTKT